LPWWGFVLAMVIAAAWMIPIGMITAITVRTFDSDFLTSANFLDTEYFDRIKCLYRVYYYLSLAW
jgi:hypothetical protein